MPTVWSWTETIPAIPYIFPERITTINFPVWSPLGVILLSLFVLIWWQFEHNSDHFLTPRSMRDLGCLPSEIIILYKIYRYFILPSTYPLKFILLPCWECEDQIFKSLSQYLDQDYNGNSIHFIVQIAAILTSTTGRPPTTEYRMTGCMRLSCSGPGSGLVRVGSLQLKPCSAGLNVSVNSQ